MGQDASRAHHSWCVLTWLQSFRRPLVQKSCFVLLLYLLAACLILPSQTCSFQSQLRSREVITKVGCEKRSSLLGFSLEASRSESHIQVSPTSSLLGCTAPLGAHDLACVSVGAGANSNVKIVLCIIYLFICLCSLNFSAGGLHPLPRCAAAQIFALGNSGGSSSV